MRPMIRSMTASLLAVILGATIVVVGMGVSGVFALSSHRVELNFTSASIPSWTSPNADLSAEADGFMLMPSVEPAILLSDPMMADVRMYTTARLRLTAQEPTQGRLGLLIETPGGESRVQVPFAVRGGGVLDEVVVALPSERGYVGILRGVLLVPSFHVQPVLVASIVLEGRTAGLDAVWDLLSPQPGVEAARSGTGINTLAPPSMAGRSIWVWLMPFVLGVAVVGFLVTGGAGRRSRARVWSRRGLVAAWGVALIFTAYYQVVAAVINVKDFGGLSLADAYREIDGVPLWDDMLDAGRALDRTVPVGFRADGERGESWKVRAAYYLYPIRVADSVSSWIQYYGRQHPPCEDARLSGVVRIAGERYCLVQTP